MSERRDADPYVAMARSYDRWFGPPSEEMLSRLRELAGKGPCLEVGVGTGRVALPLAASGVPVVGVDVSPAMLAECERRRTDEPLRLVRADAAAADFDLGERFSLVYCVFSALFDVAEHSRVPMIASLARHVRPDGHLVVETFVPRLDLFAGTAKAGLVYQDLDEVVVDLTEHDLAAQRFHNRRVVITADGCQAHASTRRYLWPPQLDLLAEAAGLRLHTRAAGWAGERYTGAVASQVAVYTLAAGIGEAVHSTAEPEVRLAAEEG